MHRVRFRFPHASSLTREIGWPVKAQWAREFAGFYGQGYFAGETSSTMAPLRGFFFLPPKRHLREAMELAAEAFLGPIAPCS